MLALFLLIKGADFLVNGASKIAEKFKIPTIIIGLTIVARVLNTGFKHFFIEKNSVSIQNA